ncbi:uncharacterized protein LOC129584501 [Paramacrobiotus metropolitanus]|uniref:uncharacterized protein LOC129584501 n=1 Tax=Paramacrobiotus metropolitanus TaxID=2943436 RepID=UPI002445905D|nr:uncharacterized protein LOC129584501 [Paramacrobiotus metropolitanus]XP_055332656.1 uncharacterized protein LOC129584501 [Paramacrobiotus metropolitanus]XP_055332657.1 uncharacterized protein LOC129584501 [Paramacrobiotus metropolitanus]
MNGLQHRARSPTTRFKRRLISSAASNDAPEPEEAVGPVMTSSVRSFYEPKAFPSPPFPAVRTSFYGRIALMNTEGFVHIRTDFLQKQFASHVNKWQSAFSSYPTLSFSQRIVSFGAPCLVNYPADGKWYRATYLGVCGREKLVFYEDFGSVEALSNENSIKVVDPDLTTGYEIPTTVYSCLLVNPKNEAEYLVLADNHLEYLRSVFNGGPVDGEVVAYRHMEVAPGLWRPCLAVLLFSEDNPEEDVATSLLQLDSEIEMRQFYQEKVTLYSSIGMRSCTALQFPEAHLLPAGQRCTLQLQYVYSNRVIVSYPAGIDVESWESRWRKMFYGDADIVESLEKNWTREIATPTPATLIMEKNSYIVVHEGKCRRAEVCCILALDVDYLSPTRVEIVLIDSGVRMEIGVEDLMQLPSVIPVQIARRAFEAEYTLDEEDEISKERESGKKCIPVCGLPRALAVSKKYMVGSVALKTAPLKNNTVAITDEYDLVDQMGTIIEAECVGYGHSGRPVLRFFKER